MEATLYNVNGQKISPSLLSSMFQTTVSHAGRLKESGIFYMSIKIKASNIGQVTLTNLKMTNSYATGFDSPDPFTLALRDTNPSQQPPTSGEAIQLDTTEQNILAWDTANSCTADAQCGASERCIDTDKDTIKDTCAIDISNFLGEITFGAELEASFTNALGQPDTTSTIINLPISFEQDEVILRFEVKSDGNLASFKDTWIAYDMNTDGTMEAYGHYKLTNLGSLCKHPGDAEFITSYGDYMIQKISPTEIGVCMDHTNDYLYHFKIGDDDSPRAILVNYAIEPYTSQNCNGARPCQERYSIRVSPASQTCFDNYQNQDETDIDCGGKCSGCNVGESCLINSDCASNYCNGGVCGEAVNFRTTDSNYQSGSAIAYSTTCGNTLVAMYKTGASTSGGTCCWGCNQKLMQSILVDNIPCDYGYCVLGIRNGKTYVCWGTTGREYGSGGTISTSPNFDPATPTLQKKC